MRRYMRLTAGAAPLLIALGAAGIATGQSHGGPLRCEILATPTNGMIALEGVVHADVPVVGSYRLRVESLGRGGSSDINQGGSFAAGPDGPVSLGRVMLGGSDAVYDASLDVTADGMTIACAERVGGAI